MKETETLSLDLVKRRAPVAAAPRRGGTVPQAEPPCRGSRRAMVCSIRWTSSASATRTSTKLRSRVSGSAMRNCPGLRFAPRLPPEPCLRLPPAAGVGARARAIRPPGSPRQLRVASCLPAQLAARAHRALRRCCLVRGRWTGPAAQGRAAVPDAAAEAGADGR